MAKRTFKLTANVAKRNQFDIFGLFEETPQLTFDEQKKIAADLAAEWVSVNSLKLGVPNSKFRLVGFTMQGSKLLIELETGV